MDDSLKHTENPCEELAITNTWKKIINTASQIGYSDGVTDGSMSVFQNGFDKGYREGFKTTLLLGVYKGLAENLSENVDHPKEIQNILENSKKGICYLCQRELNKQSISSEESLTEIQKCQNEHSVKIFQTLQNYFNPILKKNNINLESYNIFPK